MKKIVRLTESDLARIVKRVMNEAPITGQGGVRPNPANVTGQSGASRPKPVSGTSSQGGGSRPKPVSGTSSQGGGSRPKPVSGTSSQGGGSGPNAMVNVNLVIDCKRRVIQKTDVPLTLQGNSMVITAFCNPSYRKPTGGK